MTKVPPPPHSPIPEDAPPELREEVEAIIEDLRHAGSIDAQTLVLILLKNIMARLSKEMGETLSFDALTEKQQQKLEEELEKIAKALKESGVLNNEKELLTYLKRLILRRSSKNKARDVDEHDSMDEKSKKEYNRLLKLFVIYEIYKITNPNQLAGETELDNYINNIMVRDVAYANKFTDRDEKEMERLAQAQSISPESLQRKSGSFVESLTNFNKGRDTSWER